MCAPYATSESSMMKKTRPAIGTTRSRSAVRLRIVVLRGGCGWFRLTRVGTAAARSGVTGVTLYDIPFILQEWRGSDTVADGQR